MPATTSTTGFFPKLIAAFSLAAATTAATAVLAVLSARSIEQELSAAASRTHVLAEAHALRFELEHVTAAARGQLLAGDAARRESALSAVQAARRSLSSLRLSGDDGDTAAQVADVRRTAHDYLNALEEVLRSPQSRPIAAAGDLFHEQLAPKRDALARALSALIRTEDRLTDEQIWKSERRAKRTLLLLIVFASSSIVLSCCAGWFFGRKLLLSYDAERQAVERAQQALATRDDLLAVIAHDLRNSLNAIGMKAELIRSQAETGEQHPKLARHAAAIEGVVARMEFLIKGLLDAAVIDAGKFSIERSPCRPGEALQSAVEIFEPLASQKSIRLTIESRTPESLEVIADRERLVQVLSNLLGNALKFTPAGGAISVRLESADDELRFCVTDTGVGIPPDHVPELFNRYWKGGRRGTGLGLYIAKTIVEAHGGTIWVESAPEQGSRFWFTLPHSRPAVGNV